MLALRSEESTLIRDELATAEAELVEVRALARKVQRDYEAGELTAAQWSRLDADYERRIQLGERARDRLSTARRMIAGTLEGADVPRMNAKLHEVFDSLIVSLRDGWLVVLPHLRDESPMTRLLDFSEGETDDSPVEVAGNLVLRKVELTRSEGVDDPSSRW